MKVASSGSLAGAVLGAGLASACCTVPLLFAVLGVGGAGMFVRMEPLRPLFSVVTLGFLGLGHVAARRGRPSADCDCAPSTAQPAVLWVTTVLVLGLLAFPSLVPFLV